MSTPYVIRDTRAIVSPALIVFQEMVAENISHMLTIAGDSQRLRPHCKTHKMSAVVRMQLDQGITKHKAATFAEAQMLADNGVRDVCLAYNLVGPNIHRAVEFVTAYPDVELSVTADHARPIQELGQAMSSADQSINVLLDLDTGQHRTGVTVGAAALQLYGQLVETAGLNPDGFHVYDGHQHQHELGERRTAINQEWEKVQEFRRQVESRGWQVPRIVAGGTGSFPVYAEKTDAGIECSPGTCVFNDIGYGEMFRDLEFTPAAILLTRVVSRPTADRITLDLGYKAVASDPPAGKRLQFPDLPDAQEVLQNEEHLVLSTSAADRYQPGDTLLAIPRHICPTSALHKQAWVVSDGDIVDQWDVSARDRWLTI